MATADREHDDCAVQFTGRLACSFYWSRITRITMAADEEQPAIAVWTDPTGYILDATPGAARLLGLSRRALVNRLMHLFVRADRAHVLRIFDIVGRGNAETLHVELQPRERRKVAVRVQLDVDRHDNIGPVVRWVIHPITEGSTGEAN